MIFLKICLIIITIISVLILAKVWTGKIPVVVNDYDTSIIASRMSEEKFTSIVKWVLISAYIFKIIILLTTIFVL
jgi:hypothetical protein